MTKKFAKENGFPAQLCKCPFNEDSRRKKVKEFIKEIGKKNPKMNIKTNIFKSVARIKADYTDLKEDSVLLSKYTVKKA